MRFLVCLASLLCISAYNFNTQMKMSASSTSKGLKVGILAVLASGYFQTTAPVIAASTGYGKSYEVVAPKDAVIDSELASGEDYKKGAEGLAKALEAVKSIEADFAKNKQIDVGSRVANDLKANEIRINLNKYSAAFSEDTQKGSDRLIRQVIQGLTELERESQVKEGKSRSTAKTAAVQKRLAAIEEQLDQLSQYSKK